MTAVKRLEDFDDADFDPFLADDHHSSLDGHRARVDGHGKVRIVLSIEDPGVPNWLDPVDSSRGVVQWRGIWRIGTRRRWFTPFRWRSANGMCGLARPSCAAITV